MLSSCINTLALLALFHAGPAPSDCDCHAVNARYNVVAQPKTGYDFLPTVADDSQGFYVVYSAKQNQDNTAIAGSSCIYVLPLENQEVLIFGGGYGDTWYLPGGAFYDADYDAENVRQVIVSCLGFEPLGTKVHFVAPHGHPDHITVAFIKALERAGLSVVEIAFHEGDRAWIEQLPWSDEQRLLHRVLTVAPCNQALLRYASPLGPLWFVQRPGHTAGSIDLVLDVKGNPDERWLVLGSAAGSGCPPPPGVVMTLAAHGTAIIGGPRRAVQELMLGQGGNPVCLTGVTPPKLGTTWTTEVDLSAHPGATLVSLLCTDCQMDPGLITTYGELLVNLGGHVRFNLVQPVLGAKQQFSVPIPNDPSLMGQTLYAQASVLGGRIEMCNGLKLVIGF